VVFHKQWKQSQRRRWFVEPVLKERSRPLDRQQLAVHVRKVLEQKTWRRRCCWDCMDGRVDERQWQEWEEDAARHES